MKARALHMPAWICLPSSTLLASFQGEEEQADESILSEHRPLSPMDHTFITFHDCCSVVKGEGQRDTGHLYLEGASREDEAGAA